MINQDLIDYYEKVVHATDELYSGSEFMNYGYWNATTDDLASASKNLVTQLINYFKDSHGSLLNVACGNGSEIQLLTKQFNPTEITSINISQPQLDRASKKSPETQFLQMSATDLQFSDLYFDNIICIEAAFHFKTREKFLAESFRVLKPGGKLVMADILFKSNLLLNKEFFPLENQVRNLKSYENILLASGFRNIQIQDVTKQTFKPFCSYMKAKLLKQQPINLLKFLLPRVLNIANYVFVVAEKP